MGDVTSGKTWGAEEIDGTKLNQMFGDSKLAVGIIQVVTGAITPQFGAATSVATTDTDPTTTTGIEVFSATLAPRADTSRVLVATSFMLTTSDVSGLGTAPYGIALFRGSTLIAKKIIGANDSADGARMYDASFIHMDSPATGTPVTYMVRAFCSVGGGAIAVGVNRTWDGNDQLGSLGLLLEFA